MVKSKFTLCNVSFIDSQKPAKQAVKNDFKQGIQSTLKCLGPARKIDRKVLSVAMDSILKTVESFDEATVIVVSLFDEQKANMNILLVV